MIFISYAREDYDYACDLYLALKKAGLDPWMDKPPKPYKGEGLAIGQKWRSVIDTKLRTAHLVVLVLSPYSVQKRGYVQTEFRTALSLMNEMPDNKTFVLPIVSEQCEIPSLRVGHIDLCDLQWEEVTPSQLSSFANRLRAELKPLSEIKGKDALLWSLDVGRMHSRNNIIVKHDRAFLGTSGRHWNVPDEGDGVYCVDLRSGQKVWFTPTLSDANEIALIGDVLLIGTDHGAALAISSDDGTVSDNIILNGSVYARPVELEAPNGPTAILISYEGEIAQYFRKQHRFSIIGHVPEQFRANPVAVSSNAFLTGTESGAIILIEITDGCIKWKSVFHIEPHKSSGRFNYVLKPKGISSLVPIGDRIIASYARDTYDLRPPMTCFSLKTGEKLWDAGRITVSSEDDSSIFGNSRITPVIWKNQVISTFSYNDAIHAFSIETGKWLWKLRLDNRYFQNWSSPIIRGDRLYVARVNGILSTIDLPLKKLLSLHSIEIFELGTDSPETGVSMYGPWPSDSRDLLEPRGPMPSQELIAGICATPALWRDTVLVGTVSGHLCCLRDA